MEKGKSTRGKHRILLKISVAKLSKKHPNIWSFIQLIRSKHVRFEHISIQIDTGAKTINKKKDLILCTIDFSKRRSTQRKFIIANWKKTKLLLYCQFSLVFFSLN